MSLDTLHAHVRHDPSQPPDEPRDPRTPNPNGRRIDTTTFESEGYDDACSNKASLATFPIDMLLLCAAVLALPLSFSLPLLPDLPRSQCVAEDAQTNRGTSTTQH